MMLKAIYLDVDLRAEGVQADGLSALIASVRQRLDDSLVGGTALAHLTGEVKRARASEVGGAGATDIQTIVYLEGEQDAPLSFSELAVTELQTLLDEVFSSPIEGIIRVQVVSIQENPYAFDELAEESL